MATHSRTAAVGSAGPDFELPDSAGVTHRLSGLLEAGPVVLVFLRGFG